MDDQLLMTVFEVTDRSSMCSAYLSNFDATGSGTLGHQHIGDPRGSKGGEPVPMAVEPMVRGLFSSECNLIGQNCSRLKM